MSDMQESKPPEKKSISAGKPGHTFISHVIAFYGIGAALLLAILALWLASEVLLLVFASVLIAIVLHRTSCKIAQRFKLPHGLSLAIVILLIIFGLTLIGYFLAPSIASQTEQLIKAIPAALQRLQEYIEGIGWARQILQDLPPLQQIFSDISAMLTQARAVFSTVAGALGSFVIILFIGIYLAAQPQLYIGGMLRLLPREKRKRAREVVDELGDTLAQWMLGKFFAMAVVGIATAIGLALLDVPLAIALGLIAGLLDFIPYLGPILAGVPAVLIAFSQSPATALYVIIWMFTLQMIESYLLLPLVDRRTVSMPPALTITMQVMLGLPFGLLGVALATPLTAALCVLIVMLYVQDVLGDRVKTPSEH